jgi:hypothetical protein
METRYCFAESKIELVFRTCALRVPRTAWLDGVLISGRR